MNSPKRPWQSSKCSPSAPSPIAKVESENCNVAGGAVAYLPTDGTNVPDFLLAGGTTLPEVQVCYGIACHGANPQPFSALIRFEANKNGEHVALSLLLESCLDVFNGQ